MLIKRKYILIAVFILPICLYGLFTVIGSPSKAQAPPSGTTAKATKPEVNEDLEMFQALPYTQWTSSKVNEEVRGVTKHDRKRAYPGINLYANDTRDVYMFDMAGKQIHSWRL